VTRRHSFTQALQAASDFSQLGWALATECRRLSGARTAWCLLLPENDPSPVVIGGPGKLAAPPVLPSGIAAWVLDRQQTLKYQPQQKPPFHAQPLGQLSGFRSCRSLPQCQKRLQQDLAWMGPSCRSQALLWLPLAPNALLLLCRPSWTEVALVALKPALELGRLAWAMLERRRQLEQHWRQTAAVSEIAQNLSATLELDILLRLILLEITKALRCQAGDIWLKPDKQAHPVFRTGLGISAAAREQLLAGRYTQQAIETGEPVWIEDAPGRSELNRQLLQQEGIASLAVIPLKEKSKVIGILHLFARQRRYFTPAERQLIKTLSSQAAMAIENARLFEETKRRAQELLVLYDVAQVLSENSNVEVAMQQIVERVSEVLNVEKCWFLLWDEAAGLLAAPPAAVGLDEEQIADLRLQPEAPGVSTQVFRTGQTAVFNTAQEEAAVQAEFGRRFALRTLLAVGMRHQDANLGVFLAANKRGETLFDGNDVRLFRTLASEIAVVIQNAQLHARLNRS
jgi:GAF domain-containing protein